MIKIKTFLLATLLLTGLVFPATAQIGEPRSNFSVGVNGGVNLNSASFTPTIKQNSLMGITGGLTARYISEKYFAMICGAQVELNISQRGWDELFEMEDENGQTIKVPGKTYTRKMTYVDIPFLAHLAFGRERGLQFTNGCFRKIDNLKLIYGFINQMSFNWCIFHSIFYFM